MRPLLSFKFTPDASAYVQKQWFALGFKWGSGARIQYTDQPWLELWTDKTITYTNQYMKYTLTLEVTDIQNIHWDNLIFIVYELLSGD